MEDLENKRGQLIDRVPDDVVDSVNDYHDLWLEHLRTINQQHGKDLKNVRNELETKINSLIQTNSDMDLQLQTALSASKRLKNICIMRQKLNSIFNDKYKSCKDIEGKICDDVFKNQHIDKKLWNNSGVRYAIYSIYTSSPDNKISRFYLELNKIFHPKIHPDDIVKTAYNDLSEKDKREFGITNEIDTELRQLLFV
jgi:hypothetical protein